MLKSEVDYKDYCVVIKLSEKKGYKITLDFLEKLWRDASKAKKKPLLILGIKRNEKDTFTLHCNINLERT